MAASATKRCSSHTSRRLRLGSRAHRSFRLALCVHGVTLGPGHRAVRKLGPTGTRGGVRACRPTQESARVSVHPGRREGLVDRADAHGAEPSVPTEPSATGHFGQVPQEPADTRNPESRRGPTFWPHLQTFDRCVKTESNRGRWTLRFPVP